MPFLADSIAPSSCSLYFLVSVSDFVSPFCTNSQAARIIFKNLVSISAAKLSSITAHSISSTSWPIVTKFQKDKASTRIKTVITDPKPAVIFVTTFQLAVKRIRDERKGVFILKHLCGMEECWRIRLGIGKSDKSLIIHY